MKKVFKFIFNLPKNIAIGFVAIYKFCISPLFPHVCKFKPTCSTYSKQCFAEWGFFLGFILTAKRIAKCNPKSKGGIDPVPINPKKKYKNFM